MILHTNGVDHVGIGVSDVEASRHFYSELGFIDVAFDYQGPLPGMEEIAGRADLNVHIMILRNPRASVLGQGSIKLVKTLDAPPPPIPAGMAWGERGICEVSVHVRDRAAFHDRLGEESGRPWLLDSFKMDLEPGGIPVNASYLADPDGGKVELIEWPSLDAGWPGPTGPQGVNHVAFGVSSMERACDFWRMLGFDRPLYEFDGFVETIHGWFAGDPPRQRMTQLMNPRGASVQPVEHTPPSPDMRGEWGHLGPMEFAVGVNNLDQAVEALGDEGVALVGEPHGVESDSGSWRYAYLGDPDGLFVYLTENRF